MSTHRHALPTDAGLLHASRAAKLAHVFAERTLSALRPCAGLALFAAGASSSDCGRATGGPLGCLGLDATGPVPLQTLLVLLQEEIKVDSQVKKQSGRPALSMKYVD